MIQSQQIIKRNPIESGAEELGILAYDLRRHTTMVDYYFSVYFRFGVVSSLGIMYFLPLSEILSYGLC